MATLSIQEFADRINELMPVIVKEFVKRQAKELYKGKITLQQFLILNILYKEGELTMTALAKYMDVTTAAMTGVVNRLVREVYASRSHNPKDRRIIGIKLTSKGKRLVEKIIRKRRHMIVELFGQVRANEREIYLKVLMRIKDIVARQKE